MKISDVWKSYAEYTSGVSEQSRKLGFAIAAACWFFKTQQSPLLPSNALWSLIWVVVFFSLDVLQYLVAAMVVRVWARLQEKKFYPQSKGSDFEVEKPNWLDTPATILFVVKTISLLVSFGFLVKEFMNHV